MNDLNENTLNPNCFEKTKEAWGIFSFFSSTNVETKNVCPIAYNGEIAALKKANANLKQENIELRRRNNLLEKQLQDSFIKNGLLI